MPTRAPPRLKKSVRLRITAPDGDREAMRLMQNIRAGERAVVPFPPRTKPKKRTK